MGRWREEGREKKRQMWVGCGVKIILVLWALYWGWAGKVSITKSACLLVLLAN